MHLSITRSWCKDGFISPLQPSCLHHLKKSHRSRNKRKIKLFLTSIAVYATTSCFNLYLLPLTVIVHTRGFLVTMHSLRLRFLCSLSSLNESVHYKSHSTISHTALLYVTHFRHATFDATAVRGNLVFSVLPKNTTPPFLSPEPQLQNLSWTNSMSALPTMSFGCKVAKAPAQVNDAMATRACVLQLYDYLRYT